MKMIKSQGQREKHSLSQLYEQTITAPGYGTNLSHQNQGVYQTVPGLLHVNSHEFIGLWW